jgi:hypothetical protein
MNQGRQVLLEKGNCGSLGGRTGNDDFQNLLAQVTLAVQDGLQP